MFITRDPIRLISITTAILVAVLAVLAFILSYSALQHMAQANGVPGQLSYLWPLLLDFAMVVFSLAILRANLRSEPARYPWALTILFAGLATLANVLDVTALGLPAVIVAAGVKALAPVALVLAFELLMGMIRAEIRLTAAAGALATITAEVDQLTGQRDRLSGQVATLKAAKRADYTAVADDTKSRARVILAERGDISGAELGRLLGRSDSLGRKLKRELWPVNGSGATG